MLSAGLVGLPNSGKSSLFNLLTAAAAEVGEYPFTTIQENVGVVPVPDPVLDRLAETLDTTDVTPAHFQLTDIAGLVEGASQGEGLGNQFLGHIREVDAIVHVLRDFGDSDVAHVLGSVDPARDVEVVDTELLLADLELIERIMQRCRNVWKTDPRAAEAERRVLEAARTGLEEGVALRDSGLSEEDLLELSRLGLLTGRPRLFLLNVDEGNAADEKRRVELAGQLGVQETALVSLPVALELEVEQLEPGDRADFRQELGLAEHAIQRVSAAIYRLLDQIRFYTVVRGKLTAWSITRGTTMVEAAGRIHTDIAAGFIRAEVCGAEELLRAGSVAAARDRGVLRTEGREALVRDGDVVEIRFR